MITISIWWVILGSMLLTGSLVYASFKGVLFWMVKEENEGLREKNERLKLITCVSRGQCRRTPSEDIDNRLKDIGYRKYLKELNQAPTDNQQAVEESNVEAAESVGIINEHPDSICCECSSKPICRIYRPIDIPKRNCGYFFTTNPRHESTKKACKESIGHEVE